MVVKLYRLHTVERKDDIHCLFHNVYSVAEVISCQIVRRYCLFVSRLSFNCRV